MMYDHMHTSWCKIIFPDRRKWLNGWYTWQVFNSSLERFVVIQQDSSTVTVTVIITWICTLYFGLILVISLTSSGGSILVLNSKDVPTVNRLIIRNQKESVWPTKKNCLWYALIAHTCCSTVERMMIVLNILTKVKSIDQSH